MIVYILGEGQTGKSEAAKYLVNRHGFLEIALSDPMKRYCAELYQFTEEQLWGPSELRNIPDERYPRQRHGPLQDSICACCGKNGILSNPGPCYLTPRFALQMLGTEWGRYCYAETYTRYLLRTIKQLQEWDLDEMGYAYSRTAGLIRTHAARDCTRFLVPDVRYRNELEALKQAGARGFRLFRPKGGGLPGKFADHSSEVEQREIPNTAVDGLIMNHGTLEGLYRSIDVFLSHCPD